MLICDDWQMTYGSRFKSFDYFLNGINSVNKKSSVNYYWAGKRKNVAKDHKNLEDVTIGLRLRWMFPLDFDFQDYEVFTYSQDLVKGHKTCYMNCQLYLDIF